MNYETKYKNLIKDITTEYTRLKKNLANLEEFQIGCMLQLRILLEKAEEPVPNPNEKRI